MIYKHARFITARQIASNRYRKRNLIGLVYYFISDKVLNEFDYCLTAYLIVHCISGKLS